MYIYIVDYLLTIEERVSDETTWVVQQTTVGERLRATYKLRIGFRNKLYTHKNRK